jgi:tetratricopeptide (TPR) repeat protein
MNTKTEKQKHKAEKLIEEGDEHSLNGKFSKALKKYRKAHELDPEREGLADKLLDMHEKALGESEWELEDFAEHVGLTMEKQEQEHPHIKQTHAKLTPEFKDVSNLILKILQEDDDEKVGPMIEDLVSRGEIATRALVDLLRSMKKDVGEPE